MRYFRARVSKSQQNWHFQALYAITFTGERAGGLVNEKPKAGVKSHGRRHSALCLTASADPIVGFCSVLFLSFCLTVL